jgi:hypothetical protein
VTWILFQTGESPSPGSGAAGRNIHCLRRFSSGSETPYGYSVRLSNTASEPLELSSDPDRCGRNTENTVPLLSRRVQLRKRIVPLCFSITSRVSHSPSPVPTPALVVKDGLKIDRRCSVAIPLPQSDMLIRTPGRGSWLRLVMLRTRIRIVSPLRCRPRVLLTIKANHTSSPSA